MITITLSKRELLALCTHVIASQRQWTPEQSARRLKAWAELGVADLALDVSDIVTTPGLSLSPTHPYLDRKAMVNAEISPETLAFIAAQLKAPMDTGNTDYLTPLAERLGLLGKE